MNNTDAAGARVLLVAAEASIADIVAISLELQGHTVLVASDNEDAIFLAERKEIDLVILDLDFPDETPSTASRYALCRTFRGRLRTRHLPIIVLTAGSTTNEKITGLRSGADDYITKPFDALELGARVEMNLRRALRNRDLNPLTGLPGNRAVEEVLNAYVEGVRPFTVLYADLDNFKSFNDLYGFTRGDQMIRLAARCIVDAAISAGSPDDFVGHIGGDDFLLVTGPAVADSLCRHIIAHFDAEVPLLYTEEDRARGYVIAKGRRGSAQPTAFVSISIAGVSNRRRAFTHAAEISHIAAEMKSYVKSLPGSNYALNRRAG